MKRIFSWLLLALLQGSLALAAADQLLPDGRLATPAVVPASELKSSVIQPFASEVSANALIIRTRAQQDGKNYVTPIRCILTDGDYRLEQSMEPVDWEFNRADTDYELPLGEIRKLSKNTSLKLEFAAGEKPELAIYAVLPVVFRKDDLSKGLDFETPETTGLWLGHDQGTVSWNESLAKSGRKCLFADFPQGDTMISVLPGERDWSKYAVFRFTVANPMPTAGGRRTRICFLFDGKTVERPHKHDTLSCGDIPVLEESVKTFDLDLKTFAELHPNFDLKNVKSFQFFWSPVACGETTFYIDDVRLVTAEELVREENAKYLDKINALKEIPQNAELRAVIAELEKRYQAGERETLNKTILYANELGTITRMKAKSQTKDKVLLLNAPASVKIMRDEEPAATADPIQITAAGNERESFQIVAVPFEPLKGAILTSGALQSDNGKVIPASAVTVNPIGYVEILSNAFAYKGCRPGMWPDVLLDNRPFDLPTRIQSFMVTVAVPKDQPAGIYKGELTFHADNLAAKKIPFSCKVYGFSLPVRGKLKTWFSLSYVPEKKETRYKIYDMFFDYRLNPTSMYSAINDLKIDDKAVPTQFVPLPEDLPYCMEKGLNFMSIGYICNYTANDIYRFDDSYIAAIKDHIRQYLPLLKETGAIDFACVNGFDEIMHKPDTKAARLKDARRVCSAIKAEFPEFKIANIGLKMDIDRSLMDYWFMVPIPGKQFTDLKENGAVPCFYWAYQEPSFMLDQQGIAPRICAWLAWKEGAEGMGYYSTFRPDQYTRPRFPNIKDHVELHKTICTERCVPPVMPTGLDWNYDVFCCETTNYEGRNGDGTLLYPSPEGHLLPSLRMTNLRDGIEDYEYFALLKELSENSTLLAVGDDIVTVREGDYTTDIKKLLTQRNAVAEAIEQALKAQKK